MGKNFFNKRHPLMRKITAWLLCLAMVMGNITFSAKDTDAFGFFPGWGPLGGRPGGGADVLTNAVVEFTDGSYKKTAEEESGDGFFLHLSLSGNNVYQFGNGTTYSVTIDDPNLLLTNFAGNGLKNGATFSGFTVKVNEDKTRTLTYTVANGQTKNIYLAVKFANGKTPDGEVATATLSTPGSFSIKKDSVKADSNIQWTDSKTATSSVVEPGSNVGFTIAAQPKNPTATTGLWWAKSVTLRDTLTLPNGITFDGIPTKDNLASYINFTGADKVEFVSATNNSIVVDITKNSTNEKAEMGAFSVNATLLGAKLNTSEYNTKGNVNNVIDGTAIGVNDKTNTPVNIGSDSAETSISVPPAPPTPPEPNPAKIVLNKRVIGAGGELYNKYGFLQDEEVVVFAISAANVGDIESESVTLTENPDYNLVPLDSATIQGVTYTNSFYDGTNTKNVTVGKIAGNTNSEIYYYVAKVKSGTATSSGTVINNRVTDNLNNSASSSIKAKLPTMSYMLNKTVVTESGENTYNPEEKLTYTIDVYNNGQIDITNLKLFDSFNDYDLIDIETISNENVKNAFINKDTNGKAELVIPSIPTGEHATITYTVKAVGDKKIENTVSSNDGKSSKTEINANTFSWKDGKFTKTANDAEAFKGETISYTLKYTNASNGYVIFDTDNPLVFTDNGYDKTSLTFVEVRGNGFVLNEENSSSSGYILDKEKMTVSYTGKVSANSSVELTWVFKVESSATGTITANTALLSYGESDSKTSGTEAISISNLSIAVDKVAYVDNEKTFLEPTELLVEKFNEATKIDKEEGVVRPGQRVTFFITVTNDGEQDITSLKFNDVLSDNNPLLKNSKISYLDQIYIVDQTSDNMISKNETEYYNKFDAVKFSDFQWNSKKVDIKQNESITFAYQIIESDIFFNGSNTVTVTPNDSYKSVKTDSVSYKTNSSNLFIEKAVNTKKDNTFLYEMNRYFATEDFFIKSDNFDNYVQSIDVTTTGAFNESDLRNNLESQRFNFICGIKNFGNMECVSEYVFEDVLPEGLEFVELLSHNEICPEDDRLDTNQDMALYWDVDKTGSVEINGKQCQKIKVQWNEKDISKKPYRIGYKNNAAWDDGGGGIAFVYSTKLTPEKIDELVIAFKNWYNADKKLKEGQSLSEEEQANLKAFPIDFKNKVSVHYPDKREFMHGSELVTEISDTAIYSIKPASKAIAPGIKKEAVEDLDVYHENTAVSDVSYSGIPVWKITVSNAKVDQDDKPLEGLTIVDTLSGDKLIQYCDHVHTYDEDDMISVKWKPYYAINGVKHDLTASNISVSGKTITFTFTREEIILQPGQKVEIVYATCRGENEIVEKTYYNKAVLMEQNIDVNRVQEGEIVDGLLQATADYGYGGVQTESYKTIEYVGEDTIAGVTEINGYYDGSTVQVGTSIKNVLDSSIYTANKNANKKDNGNLSDGYAQGNWSNDNYILGYQGQMIEYGINVKNASTDNEIMDLVVIDRLPFVNASGDLGVVSGYDRLSAFTVLLADTTFEYTISGTTKTIDSSKVLKFYSTDLTSVLDEDADDWKYGDSYENDPHNYDGTGGTMNWKVLDENVDLSIVRAIKIVFPEDAFINSDNPESKGIPAGATVNVKFKAILPEFVANAGEENIAWNSFAYAYNYYQAYLKTENGHNKNELIIDPLTNKPIKTGSMVAEPAKVGVWVPTSSAEKYDIKINKTYVSDSGDKQTFYFGLFTKNGGEYKLYSGELKTITVEDGQTGTVTFDKVVLPQTGNIHVFETNEAGVILNEQNSVYKINSATSLVTDADNFKNGVKIETYPDNKAEVYFFNKLSYGSITLEKKFISPFNTSDSFYFALFEDLDAKNLVKDSIKFVSIDGTSNGSVGTITWDKLPEGSRYYVYETDSHGTAYRGNTAGEYVLRYVNNSNQNVIANTTPSVVTVENEELIDYSISVTKKVADGATWETFYVGVFTKNENGGYSIVGNAKAVDEKNSVVKFTISTGERPVPNKYYVFETDSTGNILDSNKVASENELSGYVIEYSNTKTDASGNVIDYEPIEFYYQAGEPITKEDTQMSVTILNRNYVESKTGSISVTKNVIKNGIEEKDNNEQFYVGIYEIVEEDGQSKFNLVEKKEIKEGLTVTFDNLVARTDKDSDKGTYYVIECDENGKEYSTGIANGYTVYYAIDGYETPAAVAEVLLDGRIYDDLTAEVGIKNTKNVVEVTLSKYEFDNKTTPIPNAELAIYDEISYKVITAMNAEDDPTAISLTEAQRSELAKDVNASYIIASGFTDDYGKIKLSDDQKAALIKGVSYLLVELSAPSKYNIANPIRFQMDDKGYIIDGNNDTEKHTSDIVMYDTAKDGNTITISKVSIAGEGQLELPGATLAITGEKGSFVDVTLTRNTQTIDKAFSKQEFEKNNAEYSKYYIETVTKADGKEVDVLTFVSGNNETVIEGLKDGDYILKETAAPNGYLVVNGWSFSIEDNTIVNKTTDNNNIVVGDSNKITVIDIAKTNITVTKIWDDVNDIEQKRPESITVNIKKVNADGTVGDSVGEITLTQDDKWVGTSEDLPVTDVNGNGIVYTIVEDTVNEYNKPTYVKDAQGNFTITNSYVPTTSISVTKIWNDNGNQDGIRPGTIWVQVMKGNTSVGDLVELSENNKWTVTIPDLPKYEAGEAIKYSVKEYIFNAEGKQVETIPGYEKKIENDPTDNPYAFTITNTHETETVDITINKSWVDNENQDGIRPEQIEVKLINKNDNNALVRGGIIIKAEDGWNTVVTGLPKYANGQLIDYTITENEVNGYTYVSAKDEGKEYSYTVTNTHIPETTSVSVTKVWDDKENQDGVRPTGDIKVNVKRGDDVVGEITLNADNNWTGKYDGLAKYSNGEEIVYRVEEVLPDGSGYSATYLGSNNVYTITNTYAPGKVNVTVNKSWELYGNDVTKPEVEVTLYEDGVKSTAEDATVKLSAANGWSYTWKELDEKREGKNVAYSVVETEVPGFISENSGISNGVVTITNTLKTGNLLIFKTITGELTEEEIEGALKFEVTHNGKSETYTIKNSNFTYNEKEQRFELVLLHVTPGEYSVKETTVAPDGTEMAVTYKVGYGDKQNGVEAKAEVEEGKDIVVAFNDDFTKDRGNLAIYKTFSGDISKEEFEGALTFKVTHGDESTIYTMKNGFKYNEETKRYELVLENLETGSYTVEETTVAPDGTKMTVTYKVGTGDATTGNSVATAVTKDDTTEVTFDDKFVAYGNLVIVKTIEGDLTAEEIAGDLTFTVTYKDENGEDKKLELTVGKDFTYNKEADRYEYRLDNTVIGDYTVTETTKTRDGYTETVTYTVNVGDESNGKEAAVKVDRNKDTVVAFADNYTRDKGNLVIYKTFSGDISKEEFEGALTFKVTHGDESTIYTMKNGFKYNEETKRYELVLENLETGSYTVEETTVAPDGTKMSVTYKVGTGEATTGNSVATAVTKDDTTEVTFDDKFVGAGNLVIVKTIEGDLTAEEIAGDLTFTVTYKDENGEDKKLELTVGKDFTYNKEADRYEYRLDNTVVGDYTVTETTKTPDGYTETVTYTVNGKDKSNGKEAAVKVDRNKDTVVAFADKYVKDAGKLVITKTIKGDVTKEEAEGALTFKVTGPEFPEGKTLTLKEFKTTDGKTYTYELDNLKVGSYSVEETTKDIKGNTVTVSYKIDAGEAKYGDKADVVIAKDKTVNVSFEDDYKAITGKLVITKTIKGDITKEEAEGALTFTVKGPKFPEGKTFKLSDFTLEDGVYTLSFIFEEDELGEYTVVETTKDVDGKDVSVSYSIDGAKAQSGESAKATVSSDKTTTVAFEDTYKIKETSSTEAPSTEAPTTEAPSTEAPTTEAPSTEAPTTEAPSTEAPTTEAPSTEAPRTEAPTTEAPSKPASGKGDLVIVVRDEITGEVVEGVVVEIVYPDGTKEEATTDSDGVIRRPGTTLGDYIITVVRVPDNKNVTVGGHKTVKVESDSVTRHDVLVSNGNKGQTGDDNQSHLPILGKTVWPISVFSVLGLFFMAIGYFDLKRRKREDEE